jgi:hypothetical protein
MAKAILTVLTEKIDVASLVVDGTKRTEPPSTLPPPSWIALKDQIWHGVSKAVAQ